MIWREYTLIYCIQDPFFSPLNLTPWKSTPEHFKMYAHYIHFAQADVSISIKIVDPGISRCKCIYDGSNRKWVFSFWIYTTETLCQKSCSRNSWVLVLNNHVEHLGTDTVVIYHL